jgi:hypothetical protein
VKGNYILKIKSNVKSNYIQRSRAMWKLITFQKSKAVQKIITFQRSKAIWRLYFKKTEDLVNILGIKTDFLLIFTIKEASKPIPTKKNKKKKY